MSELTNLSLFSGIGGLDLAAEWAGFRTVGQCELADYPRAVLEKHWPELPRWRDIHDLTADDFFRKTGLQSVTCISGGFPCQPHSYAGKRKASGDERDLWPEMRRVIGEIKPKYVVGENVRGLLSSENGRFFLGVLRDFAEMGYDVGWGVTSAAAVGAIHRRERVAIIAHSSSVRCQCDRKIQEEGQQPDKQSFSDVNRGLLSILRLENPPGVYRGADGVSSRLDRYRVLGNAVVPQQFYPVFRAIADVEKISTAII